MMDTVGLCTKPPIGKFGVRSKEHGWLAKVDTFCPLTHNEPIIRICFTKKYVWLFVCLHLCCLYFNLQSGSETFCKIHNLYQWFVFVFVFMTPLVVPFKWGLYSCLQPVSETFCKTLRSCLFASCTLRGCHGNLKKPAHNNKKDLTKKSFLRTWFFQANIREDSVRET